jgi:hypothetical protein
MHASPNGDETLRSKQLHAANNDMNVEVQTVLGIYKSHERRTEGNKVTYIYTCEYVAPWVCGTKRTNTDGSTDFYKYNLHTLIEHIPAVIYSDETEEEHYFDESGVEYARYTMTVTVD